MARTAQYQAVWFRVIWQMGGILLLGSLLGLSVNLLRSGSLPLIQNWSSEAQLSLDNGDSFAISLDEAEALYCSLEAVFLDARSRELYNEGHIQGALSLPWDEYEKYHSSIMQGLPLATNVIVYCDGVSCGLSKELALALLDKGYTNVRVLVNGWSLWLNRKLPIEALIGGSG
jgi:rhodanese-related sulfurtransferase